MTPTLTNTITLMSSKIKVGYEDLNCKEEMSKQHIGLQITLTAVATIHIDTSV
jgi:hypothetical protein